MHAPSAPWWPPVLALTIEAALVVALGFGLQFFLRSGAWRRGLWHAVVVTLGLLALIEMSGLARSASAWLQRWQEDKPSFALRPSEISSWETSATITTTTAPIEDAALAAPDRVAELPRSRQDIRWPAAVWLMVATLLVLRTLASRILFMTMHHRRRREIRDPALLGQVQALAARMGLRQRVSVSEMPGLTGPIAFGVLRPSIGLPEGFERQFSRTQKEAMLAHELAHLAARDPLWQLVADLMVSLLWWHPLAWWARRQHRADIEAAADEATLLIENGPQALAECLVQLGGRLLRKPSLGGIGIDGANYRSTLGRRVTMLLRMNDRPWRPRERGRGVVATLLGLLLLAAAMLAGTSWMPQVHAQSDTVGQAFQKSVIGLAWASVLQVQSPGSGATAQVPVDSDRIDWKPWSRVAVAEARAQGHPVLAFFTADWSVAARANEQTSLDLPAVREKLRAIGAVALRADHARADDAIAGELRAFNRASVPLALVYSADAAALPQVLPDLLTPEVVLRALEQASGPGTRQQGSTSTTDSSRKNEVPHLILQANALLDAGRLDEAEARLRQALNLDPANPAATHYLERIKRARAQGIDPRLEPMPLLGALPLVGRLFRTNAPLTGSNETTSTRPAYTPRDLSTTTAGRKRIFSRLDSIIIPEVDFDGVPLSEVIPHLHQLTKAGDPEGHGVNLIVNSAGPPDRANSTNGLSLAPAGTGVEIMKTVIRLHPALRKVTLREALDAVVKCAEVPLKYTVEAYAVVISAREQEPLPLHTRSFKVDSSTLAADLRKTLGAKSGSEKASGAEAAMLADFRRLLESFGVNLAPPKALFYNDRQGVLMVRATLQDLDTIEHILQSVNTSPPQLTIEVRLCEVTEEDGKALGFDWLLGQARGNIATGQAQGQSSTSTNAAGPALTAILTEAQSRVVLRALEQRTGVDILAAPRVTTLSGGRAQIKVVEVRYVVTDLAANKSNEKSGPPVLPVTEPFELGPVIDVEPRVLADGLTIAMTVIPTIKEFVGYDLESAKQIQNALSNGAATAGWPLDTTIPLPVFRLRQIVASATVTVGQTLVLSGGSTTFETTDRHPQAKNPAALEKAVSALGQRDPTTRWRKSLLVFVTPTIIDPAGNRVHSQDQLPARQDSGSQQPKRTQ